MPNVNFRAATGDRKVATVLYRPFDIRFTVYDSNVAVHRRERVSSHMLAGQNDSLVCVRQVAEGVFSHALTARSLVDNRCTFSSKGIAIQFPLWLYRAGGDRADLHDSDLVASLPSRAPNLDPRFIVERRRPRALASHLRRLAGHSRADELMSEIDATIDRHGGWPTGPGAGGAFSLDHPPPSAEVLAAQAAARPRGRRRAAMTGQASLIEADEDPEPAPTRERSRPAADEPDDRAPRTSTLPGDNPLSWPLLFRSWKHCRPPGWVSRPSPA